MTIKEVKLKIGNVLQLILIQAGGKPVIYLHSPDEINASVKRSLVPESDGSLIERSIGTDVAYLFWEAE